MSCESYVQLILIKMNTRSSYCTCRRTDVCITDIRSPQLKNELVFNLFMTGNRYFNGLCLPGMDSTVYSSIDRLEVAQSNVIHNGY